MADVRNAPDPVLPDSVRVDFDVEFEAGRPGILRMRREHGFEQVSWNAGTGPTGLGGRGLGAGEELGVPDPAGPDPFRYPGAKRVGLDCSDATEHDIARRPWVPDDEHAMAEP